MAGKQLSEIAEYLDTTPQDVLRLLAERYGYDAAYLSSLDKKSLLAMEMMRLDALQAAAWPAAMMGDPASIDKCIKIVQTRSRICGLEQVDPVIQKQLVLVVGDTEDDYIAALRRAASD